jgi:hypothetical protein
MGSNSHLAPILNDEALTRDLGDEEARVLIEWLIDWAEQIASDDPHDSASRMRVLVRRGRALARFVALWNRDYFGPALQLAAVERFDGPLPNGPVDSCLLMQRLVLAESRCLRSSFVARRSSLDQAEIRAPASGVSAP